MGGSITLSSSVNTITTSGPTARTITIPSVQNDTIAMVGAANTFTGNNTYSGTIKLGSTGTPIKVVKMGTGTLSSGSATISDAVIVTSQCTVEVFHLGTGTTANFGLLMAYPAGTGTAAVKSSNSADNDTFTYRITTY